MTLLPPLLHLILFMCCPYSNSLRTACWAFTNPAQSSSAITEILVLGPVPFSETIVTCAVPVTRGSQLYPGSQGVWVERQPYHFTGHPLSGLITGSPSVHHCQEEDDIQFHGSAGKSNYGEISNASRWLIYVKAGTRSSSNVEKHTHSAKKEPWSTYDLPMYIYIPLEPGRKKRFMWRLERKAQGISWDCPRMFSAAT